MTELLFQLSLIIILMIFYNFVSHKILHDKYHLPFALISTFIVLAAGKVWLDMSWTQMGYGLIYIPSGIIAGLIFAIFLAGIIAIGSTHKHTKNHFFDSRVLGLPYKKLFKKTLIEIPIITVLFEETLFRGLLLGYFLQNTTELYAILWTSILFGVWHILPAVNFVKTNKTAKGLPIATILGTVLFTTLTGVAFAILRIRSNSIVAPMIIHYVSNSGGFIASWFAVNNSKN